MAADKDSVIWNAQIVYKQVEDQTLHYPQDINTSLAIHHLYFVESLHAIES